MCVNMSMGSVCECVLRWREKEGRKQKTKTEMRGCVKTYMEILFSLVRKSRLTCKKKKTARNGVFSFLGSSDVILHQSESSAPFLGPPGALSERGRGSHEFHQKTDRNHEALSTSPFKACGPAEGGVPQGGEGRRNQTQVHAFLPKCQGDLVGLLPLCF